MTSPLPNEPDVHLVVRMRGYHLHYVACRTAALISDQDEGSGTVQTACPSPVTHPTTYRGCPGNGCM
jgi:hypothetical protein